MPHLDLWRKYIDGSTAIAIRQAVRHNPCLLMRNCPQANVILAQTSKSSQTCSPNNFDLVKSLGADHVLNYSDPAAPSAIRALTKDSLSLCVDCFSEQTSYEFCSQILGKGATYVCIGALQPDRTDIQFKMCVGVLYFKDRLWNLQLRNLRAQSGLLR